MYDNIFPGVDSTINTNLYQVDEDLAELLYWHFHEARKKTPENERLLFKQFLRQFARRHM